MTARFCEKKDDKKIQCFLCPHHCLITPGKYGICRVRFNHDGELQLPFYGMLSAQSSDPIEKKPLYHYYPGQSIFSVGFWGCSFKCPFCQNYRISQNTFAHDYVSPGQVIERAGENGSFGIAYTYSEPLIHMEYVLDCAKIARQNGLKNVLVSNGFVNEAPGNELLDLFDAANIDLKSFNSDFYKKEIGGKLDEVKRFIICAAKKIHVEVTTLVIPGKNSDESEIEGIAQFLASIDPDIPLHLSCYYPIYKYTIPSTPPELVEKLARAAKKHLNYVYVGNVGLKETNTMCSECGNILIQRTGYNIRITGIKNGSCLKCHTHIPVIGT
jgi:pyruvate formate lyase activating enzyme